VTEAAAKPGLASARRWRSRASASRLVQYVLLQALIVIVCIFALRQPASEPPSRYLVTTFSLKDNGAERSVTLPDFVASRSSMNDPALYTGSFAWPDGEPQRAWSVYLPRFTNGVEVAVNGVVILDSRRDPAANRPDRNTPEIAVIPASLLRDGPNHLAVRLFVWGPISGFLDRIYVANNGRNEMGRVWLSALITFARLESAGLKFVTLSSQPFPSMRTRLVSRVVVNNALAVSKRQSQLLEQG